MNLFDIAGLNKQLEELEKKTMEENFWGDSKSSSKVLAKIKAIKNKTNQYTEIKNEINNIYLFILIFLISYLLLINTEFKF